MFDMENHYEYNENGDVTHFRGPQGEYWIEYNSNGQIIKETLGDELIRELTYDERGLLIRVVDNHLLKGQQSELRLEYDKRERLIHKINNPNDKNYFFEEFWEYDDRNRITKYRNCTGYIEIYSYDENGKRTMRTMIENN